MITEADQALRDLDDELAATGETIALRKKYGKFFVECRTLAKFAERQSIDVAALVPGDRQKDQLLIVSPSGIIRANWPGPQQLPLASRSDKHIPQSGVTIISSRGTLTVQQPGPIYIGTTLVRINVLARGL